jgi:hypothetical protein
MNLYQLAPHGLTTTWVNLLSVTSIDYIANPTATLTLHSAAGYTDVTDPGDIKKIAKIFAIKIP